MDDGGIKLVLQVATVFLGGGAVQILVFVMRRRSELRNVDAKTESITASVQDQLTQRLNEVNERQASQVTALEAKIETLRSVAEVERQALIDRLVGEQAANRTLTEEVARLRIDLNVARRQIEDLLARLENPTAWSD